MELTLTNSSTTIPTHVSVPSVLLQIFAGLQNLQLNTSQPQVLVQILPQPHSHFIHSLQQTDRGKYVAEENRVLRLRAQELLDSVVHIQNVVQEFKEQTQAAEKQTASIIERLGRNQRLMNRILQEHGNPNETYLDSSGQSQSCPESLVLETQPSFGDNDLENDTTNEILSIHEDINHTGSMEVNDVPKVECFPAGTKEKMYSFVKELRDLQAQAGEATAHLRVTTSNIFANSTWLHKGLENCLYFQEASKQKGHLIKELEEKVRVLQQEAGDKETCAQEGRDQFAEPEELNEQLKRVQNGADEREELVQELRGQISSTVNELMVAKEQLQQYQNLAEERGVQLEETKEQLHHFQQLAEVRQLMLLEAKENLALIQKDMEDDNSTTTDYHVPENQALQVQRLVDGRQHLPQEGSNEDANVENENQDAEDYMDNRRIQEETKYKARLHAILGVRSKETALMEAAEKGDVAHIEFLLDYGVNVDAEDTTKKQTPLMRAAESGHLEAAKLLIQRGASLDARATGWYNLTPLLYAAANKHLNVVKLLVEAGADITAVDSLGKTASVLGGQEIQDWLEGRTV